MGFNLCEFEIALLKSGKNKEDIAKELGINLVTLYRKINGTSDFFRIEIQTISEILNLSNDDKEKIFLTKILRKRKERGYKC